MINYIEIAQANPLRAIFSNKNNKENEYNKVKINLIKKDGREQYQIEKFTDKQAFHENIEKDELSSALEKYMGEFKQMTAISEEFTFDVKISKKGKVFYSKKKQKNKVKHNVEHNKKKNYILEEGMLIQPLIDLGVFTKEGKVVNSKYDKYKQINRFVEIIDDEVKKVEDEYKENNKILHILDFGCGKSYLTFILYYYFTEIKKMQVKITGLDLKEKVIEDCNEIANKYNYENLNFELGDINGFKYENNVDMVITLHACDTATDYALYNAINWNARMIFSVPCCQHEVNASIKPNSLELISKYGLIKERMSALMTDSVRANLLEAVGYKTQLLEFIDFSHSPKNILIRATKSSISRDKKKKAIKQVEDLRAEFNFDQTLYNLLKKDERV